MPGRRPDSIEHDDENGSFLNQSLRLNRLKIEPNEAAVTGSNKTRSKLRRDPPNLTVHCDGKTFFAGKKCSAKFAVRTFTDGKKEVDELGFLQPAQSLHRWTKSADWGRNDVTWGADVFPGAIPKPLHRRLVHRVLRHS